MCGIYGITDKDPNFIQQYIDTCTHRGPDGSKIKTIQGITLGHNLLSIMADPAMSTQPWDTPAGNTLIYNGEIFNYHELKENTTTNSRIPQAVTQNYSLGDLTNMV